MTRETVTRTGGWVVLLLLLSLTAISLIKYAGWSAVVSGYYGLPSQQVVVSHASRLAKLWLSGLIFEEIVATVILFALLPARLRLLRLFIAVLAIPLGTGVVAYVLVIAGHPLH